MLDVLLTILGVLWWLFNTTGFAAAVFCFAALVGNVMGHIRSRYPDFRIPNKATWVHVVLWLIGMALLCSAPILNWLIAILLYCNDKELFEAVVEDMEIKYGLTDDM